MRHAAVVVFVGGAAIFTPVAAQAGGTTVEAALKAQQKVVFASPAFKFLQAHPNVNTPAQAKALISKSATIIRLMEQAATVVGNASASTPTQKQARHQIVTGLLGEANGFQTEENGLKELVTGHKAQAEEMIKKGQKALRAAGMLEQSGVKLLRAG
jgi:hypothetical protein